MPNGLDYFSNYWDKPELKKEFQNFTDSIFGLDFVLWKKNGYWDDDYMPFSFFKDGKVVSSVCLYKIAAIVNGKQTFVYQFSAVATLPEYRKKGLNKILTDRAMEVIEGTPDLTFLFSTDMAKPYYEKYGFIPSKEYYVSIDPSGSAGNMDGLKPLGSADNNFIYKMIQEREPVSAVFASLNDKLTMFHTFYKLEGKLYYIKEPDAIICMERKEGILTIYDIIARKMPLFSELKPYLPTEDIGEIKVLLPADKIKPEKYQLKELTGNNFYIFGENKVSSELIVPFTMQA